MLTAVSSRRDFCHSFSIVEQAHTAQRLYIVAAGGNPGLPVWEVAVVCYAAGAQNLPPGRPRGCVTGDQQVRALTR